LLRAIRQFREIPCFSDRLDPGEFQCARLAIPGTSIA
jgi:hypothetical protein